MPPSVLRGSRGRRSGRWDGFSWLGSHFGRRNALAGLWGVFLGTLGECQFDSPETVIPCFTFWKGIDDRLTGLFAGHALLLATCHDPLNHVHNTAQLGGGFRG